MQPARKPNFGFSLIELLIVVSLMGILAAILIPQMQPTIHDQLVGTAQLVSADLAYARSLAVTNNSTYRVAFDDDANRYVLEHVGSNSLLDALPASPFRRPDDPPDEHVVDLDDLPQLGPSVRVVAVHRMAAVSRQVKHVVFGPLGETGRAEPTIVWLACAVGADRRYVPLTINPVTGLVTTGDVTPNRPPDAAELLVGAEAEAFSPP